jgi:hypothetical protein
MKFLLITSMLMQPMVYADEATCNKAAAAIQKLDTAVCIPAGIDKSEEATRMMQNFLKSFSSTLDGS